MVQRKKKRSELLEALDEDDLPGFTTQVKVAQEIGANFEEVYGVESGNKTILHLALEEDDGLPYCEELIKAGASASFFNHKLGCAPIHVAADEGESDKLLLLLQDQTNKADINVKNRDGLTAIHILLARLMDLSAIDSKPIDARPKSFENDEELQESIEGVMECLRILLEQPTLRINFDGAVEISKNLSRQNTQTTLTSSQALNYKKLSTMTPLQTLCSFQTWNAKPISENLHDSLEKLVSIMLFGKPKADPNATVAKNALPGTVPGSTPPVLLAATRGYYKVVEVFKRHPATNFLISNKFQQTILHIVLKAGYYNKIVVHGDDSGYPNINTVYALFDVTVDGNNGLEKDTSLVHNKNFPKKGNAEIQQNRLLREQMVGILNRRDTYGNTPLHYAKPYPDQNIVKLLLSLGAKLDVNTQGIINMHPRTLEEYFYESCIIPEGDDIDDEDFKIRVIYKIFEKSSYSSSEPIEVTERKAIEAWSATNNENIPPKSSKNDFEANSNIHSTTGSGKVDTQRLEYFSEIASLRTMLKHPLLISFLELEMSSMRIWFFLDFFIYLIFVILQFTYLGNRYGVFKVGYDNVEAAVVYEDDTIKITIPLIILWVYVLVLILREFWQIFKYKKRYFVNFENYVEWVVIVLVALECILRIKTIQFESKEELLRHIAALVLLLAFMELYFLTVRIAPNSPFLVYINMFTTVLKTYTIILTSYFPFLLSFAYSFFLIFGRQPIWNPKVIDARTGKNAVNVTTVSNADSGDDSSDPFFANIGLSLVKTLVMFVGEMDYTDLIFSHWLGYLIFILFIYFLMIVLMNILNGLAVSDIGRLQEEADNFYLISTVEILSHTNNVKMLADEIIIYPNIKPQNSTLFGIDVPGTKVYKVQTRNQAENSKGKSKKETELFLKENTVKATKELVAAKQQQSHDLGAKMTLAEVGNNLVELKREQANLKNKLNSVEENIKTILDIMVSRNPKVERL